MKQSRLMSLIEAITNVVVGYGIAVVTQLLVFPWFGLPAHLDDALALGGIFTLVSLIRGFALRRLFEALRLRPSGMGRLAWDSTESASLEGNPIDPLKGAGRIRLHHPVANRVAHRIWG